MKNIRKYFYYGFFSAIKIPNIKKDKSFSEVIPSHTFDQTNLKLGINTENKILYFDSILSYIDEAFRKLRTMV